MKRLKRMLARLTLVATLATIAVTSGVPPAYAADTSFLLPADQHYLTDCGRFWPSTGYFQTTHVSGDNYVATLDFTVTQAQINSLSCVSPYLELDFRIFGFSTPPEWDGYTVSTNIPGAIHDVATSDFAVNESTPGVTRIWVGDLQAGVEYYASVAFNQPLYPAGGGPRVSFEWVPSYWASAAHEQAFCALARPLMGDAECVFGKARAFLSHGYTNNVSLIFDGYRWWEFSSTTPTSSTPPSTDIAPPPSSPNYTADRTILHGPDGSLYVMAGGAKYAFGSWNEFVGLGYSTLGMVDVSSNTLSTIPNVPREGTVLRSGGGQLYVVAGGVKFVFGTMSEYYGQGYTDGQWINVPQVPLNAIGDAPGNMPVDGTLLRHPNGSIFLVAGGAKLQFGSMSEYTSLGYSTSRLAYVSGAPLDAIPTASVSTPPRNGRILRSGGGQIYVIAGGAKFHYGSISEYYSLGALGTDWINAPQAPLDSIGDAPGNKPKNGTVLRSGGGQLYVMAGGAKFYFGSMSEYTSLGYTNSSWTTVPQAPLDAIGDAPGNLPANETLLQGSSATVWVMKNGQRKSFTSSQQFTALGYSWNNITRVPDGPLSGIPNGGPLP